MGPIVPMKPGKVGKLLLDKPHRYMWYQDTINLFQNRVVGPFDFEDGHRVPAAVWTELLKKAPDHNLYVGAVNRVVPLDKPDEEDVSKERTMQHYLALRWNIMDGATS